MGTSPRRSDFPDHRANRPKAGHPAPSHRAAPNSPARRTQAPQLAWSPRGQVRDRKEAQRDRNENGSADAALLFAGAHRASAWDGSLLGGPVSGSLQDLLGDDSPIQVGGWTQIGYHSDNTNFTPQTALSFNNRQGELNLHQQWLWMAKEADGSEGLDWGFRADVMYGIDGTDTQAFGSPAGSWDFLNGWDHGAYSFAMPQLYGELAMGDVSVIVGHFYTLIGYEVVTAPDNFFYSHAFTMFNSEPFTHTGALATYSMNDDVTLYAGQAAVRVLSVNEHGVDLSLTDVQLPLDAKAYTNDDATRSLLAWSGQDGLDVSLWSNASATLIHSEAVSVPNSTEVVRFDDASGLLVLRSAAGGVTVHDVDSNFATLTTLPDATGAVAIDEDLVVSVASDSSSVRLYSLKDGSQIADLALDLTNLGTLSDLELDSDTQTLTAIGSQGLERSSSAKARMSSTWLMAPTQIR